MTRIESLQKLRGISPAVLPSLLLCDFAALQDEIGKLETAGFKALHLDVMDGVFVPNFTYGITIVEAVRKCTELPIDVHLMMTEPQRYLRQFRDAGADVMTIHVEAVDDPATVLRQIRDLDAVSGIALNPATPVSSVGDCLDAADLALVMSVDAGFGGQSFDESVLPKFNELRDLARHDLLLQINGGINAKTMSIAGRYNIDLYVAGSAVFRSQDYQAALEEMIRELGAFNERI